MSSTITDVGNFVIRLLQGGTFEIILLIVLVIVALCLFLVALWVAWKLLVLLGKGLLWVFRAGGDTVKGQTQARREARLAAPPEVATGWGSSPRIRLSRAFREARGLAGSDALWAVVVAGNGMGDLCRSIGLTPPGVGSIGVAAGAGVVLVDASKADGRMLRRLANALPWRRPMDAVVALVGPDGIPGDALARTASIARATGMRVALHLVLSSTGKVPAWRIIDARNRDGSAICMQLAADAVRIWLSGGSSREGMAEMNLAQSRELPASIDRAVSTAPNSIDISSLCFSGGGLRRAMAQTVERTHPVVTSNLTTVVGVTVLAVGAGLAALVLVAGLDRASSLRAAVDTAAREAAVPWTAQGIDSIPSSARVRRVAGLSVRLAEQSEFSPLIPLAPFVPNYGAPGELGAAFLGAYVLRPLASALDRHSRELLEPTDDPARWLDQARRVGEWLTAWEALADDPREVDVRRLLAGAFGGDEEAWSEGTDLALVRTSAKPPPPARGGLDTDRLTELARSNFVATMQHWADKVYTDGPAARAARRVADRSAPWREQHAGLVDLRAALQDPAQRWLTAAKDVPDLAFELRVLGRALGLSILGQATSLEAKAAVAKIRIAARRAPDFFILPGIGPLMVRSSTGGSRGPSLAMSPAAAAWLSFLDRIANAGFDDLLSRERPPPLAGFVTVDPVEVSETLRKLQVFDRFASDLPADIPPAVARNLIRELTNELVIGVAANMEQALRPRSGSGLPSERAERLARIGPSLADLSEIEAWLRERQAIGEADRVLRVRGRIAESVLDASAEALAWEDPLGVYPDPAADGAALTRRFERGLAHLHQMHEQLAAPFVEAARWTGGPGSAAAEWQTIERDIEAHQRGETDAVLSSLKGMIYAYAEDPDAACEASRPLKAVTREDYVASALSRFRSELDRICASRELTASRAAFLSLAQYFKRDVAWLWPYTGDTGAPEVPISTMGEFVKRLTKTRSELADLDEAVALFLLKNVDFWDHADDGGTVVRFRVDWRTRPAEEHLAEHVIAFGLEGVEIDEDGIHVWRYGAPLSLRVRLAKNSPYRFVDASDTERLETVVAGGGNGAFLRIFSQLSDGAWTFVTPILRLQGGGVEQLRVSARISRADGSPMTLPAFSEYPKELLTFSPETGGG